MRKEFRSFMLAAMMALTAASVCGAEEEAVNPNAEAVEADAAELKAQADAIDIDGSFDDSYTWSLATTYSTGTPQVTSFQEFADKVNEYTDGAVTVNVFADSALMGENDAFLALKSGELEFAGFGPSPVYLYSEDVGFVLAPYLIPNFASYKAIYNSDAVKTARELWREEYNSRDLTGMVYRGMRNMSSNKAIYTIEDLNNVKLRMNDNQMWAAIWSSLGATTVPMALGELYTGLQNGTVDASEGPWEQIASNNLGEVQDYIIETGHVCETVGIWMAENLYQELPENYQKAIDKAALEACADMELGAIEMENEYRQQLIDAGCEFISKDEIDLDAFKTKAEEIHKEYFESTWTSATYDEIMALIQ